MDKNYIEKIRNCKLMFGIENLEDMLNCFGTRIANYSENEEIVGYGDSAKIVIILSGSAIVLYEDYLGNRNIINRLGESDIFGAAYLFANHEISTRLVTESKVTAALFNSERIHAPCEKSCINHAKFLYNAVKVISNNCIEFLEKVEHLSRRTMREKVLSYLTACSIKNNSLSFDIPFTRQELADYLAVDRSALSTELSKMQKAGLISFKRSHFHLKS